MADFGCDSAERIITVHCGVLSQRNFSELVSVPDNMAEQLDPSKGLRQLVLEDVPDRYFMARLSDSVDCERLLRWAGAFDLKFVCPDPNAYALTGETYTISSAGSYEIKRTKGNTYSEPIYLLKGVISGAATYVLIRTNGEELRIIGVLAAGETLVIDSGKVTSSGKGRNITISGWTGTTATLTNGRFGRYLRMNISNLTTEKTHLIATNDGSFFFKPWRKDCSWRLDESDYLQYRQHLLPNFQYKARSRTADFIYIPIQRKASYHVV